MLCSRTRRGQTVGLPALQTLMLATDSSSLERRSRLIPLSGELTAFKVLVSMITNNRRLLKHALELQKPVLMLNVGPTRAEGIAGVEKIEMQSGTVLREVVRALLCVPSHSSSA